MIDMLLRHDDVFRPFVVFETFTLRNTETIIIYLKCLIFCYQMYQLWKKLGTVGKQILKFVLGIPEWEKICGI